MFRKKLLFSAIILLPLAVNGMTAGQIIRRVDRQQRVSTSAFRARMTIRKGSRILVKQFHGYGRQAGTSFFFAFTNPADRGVKYLRRNNSLWIYFPDADDIMRISGHMLRRGLMGSDVSYEDLMEYEHFEKKYRARLLGTKTVRDRPCYEILCTARRNNLTYYKQRLFVDKTRLVILKLQLYTRSGRMIKEFNNSDVRKIGWRYAPFKIKIRDMRRTNSLTTISYSMIRFNIRVPAGTFTRRNLRR